MWLLFLFACDEYGLASGTVDTGAPVSDETTDNCDGDLCIDEITPSWGPSSGGTEVRIHGSGFDGDIGVSFARLEVSDVIRLGPNELYLMSPAGSNGPIDITVWSDYGEVTIENGFTYSDNGVPTDTGATDTGSQTTDTGSGGNNSGAGLVGGVVEFSMIVDGFLLATTEGYSISANARLHDPINGSWLSWLAPIGNCVNFSEPPELATLPLQLGNWAYLTDSINSIPLQFNGSKFASAPLSPDDYNSDVSYDLFFPDHNLTITNAITPARGLGTTNFGPAHFFTGGDYTTNYYMKNATYFTWDVDTSGASTMLFIFEVLDGSNGMSLGQFQCHSPDTGSYQLPPTIFEGALYGDLIIIQMLRVRTSTSINPLNGSTIEGFSTKGGIGVAFFVQ